MESALTRTLALVAERFGLQTGWVWLLDPDSEQFYSAAVYNLPPFLQQPVQMTGEWCRLHLGVPPGSLTPRNVDVMECSRLRRAMRQQPRRRRRPACATTPPSPSPSATARWGS